MHSFETHLPNMGVVGLIGSPIGRECLINLCQVSAWTVHKWWFMQEQRPIYWILHFGNWGLVSGASYPNGGSMLLTTTRIFSQKLPAWFVFKCFKQISAITGEERFYLNNKCAPCSMNDIRCTWQLCECILGVASSLCMKRGPCHPGRFCNMRSTIVYQHWQQVVWNVVVWLGLLSTAEPLL